MKFFKMRKYALLSMIALMALTVFFSASSRSAYAASLTSPHTYRIGSIGLVHVDPKTLKPILSQGVSPDGYDRRDSNCGSQEVWADTGVGRNIIITVKISSSQGWITSGSWHVTVPNAGTNGWGFGWQGGPNFRTGYTQSTPLARTVYGVNFDGATIWTTYGWYCVGLGPHTWATSGG